MAEPTSALAAKTEEAFHKVLEKIYDGKTVLVVVNRLANIRNAHGTIVVKDETIAEMGTYEELVQNRSVGLTV
jgi:ABC-type multidrug transport system fused ATPase/permease subunit